jgi:hypothetical protein
MRLVRAGRGLWVFLGLRPQALPFYLPGYKPYGRRLRLAFAIIMGPWGA